VIRFSHHNLPLLIIDQSVCDGELYVTFKGPTIYEKDHNNHKALTSVFDEVEFAWIIHCGLNLSGRGDFFFPKFG
jgi:hypothetical protein